MLGLPKGKVFLVQWTEEWIIEFNKEAELLQKAIGELIINIHHIGSTAIRNLSAKPIIDIAIELQNFDDGLLCAPKLEQLGYSYKGTDILPDRHYFNKGDPRTHQIHMYQTGSDYLNKQLIFRNYMNENESAREQYQELKQILTNHYQFDKHAYADAKSEFIQEILMKATRRRSSN